MPKKFKKTSSRSSKHSCNLTPKTAFTITGIVFSLMALLHVLRVANNWQASIAGWTVPIELSYLGIVLASFLAYMSFHELKHHF